MSSYDGSRTTIIGIRIVTIGPIAVHVTSLTSTRRTVIERLGRSRRRYVGYVTALYKQGALKIIIEGKNGEEVIGSSEIKGTLMDLWQVTLHHFATIQPAVNGYLTHRTAIEI